MRKNEQGCNDGKTGGRSQDQLFQEWKCDGDRKVSSGSGAKEQKSREKRQQIFLAVSFFGKSAEFAERYLHKGTQICISGRLQTGSYVNNENQKVTTTEIVVEDTSFAGPKQENTMSGNTMPNNQGYGAYAQQQSGYQTGPNNMQMPQMPCRCSPDAKQWLWS